MLKHPFFDAQQFDGYQLASVTQLTESEIAPAIQPTSRNLRTFRTILIHLLTLSMMGGLLFLLRPFKTKFSRVCQHPAFWLGVTGAIGLLIAPIFVSLAIIFVAITLAFNTDPAVN